MQNRYVTPTAAHDGPNGPGVGAIVEEHPSAIPLARPARIARPIAGSVVAPRLRPVYARAAQVTAGVQYASFGARVAAALIDFVILQIASMLISGVFASLLLGSLSTATIVVATIGPVVLGGLLALVYSVWLESSAWQATPGKMMLGLKVVDLRGQRIGFGKASWRNLAKGLSMLTLGVGYLMPLWTSRRQALHDSATGCLVVRAL